jgi:hypothetical protein
MTLTIVRVSWIAGALLSGVLTVGSVGCQKEYYTEDHKYIGEPERVEGAGEKPREDKKEAR